MFYYFDKIKKEISILDVISYYEGKAYPDNTDFVCCPSATHPDKHPSAKINRKGFAENTCHCFSCSRTFNVLTVVKEATGAEDDIAAATRLFSDLHIDPTPYVKGKAEIQKSYLSPEESRAIGMPNFDRLLTEPTRVEMDGKVELIPPEPYSELEILQMIMTHASDMATWLSESIISDSNSITEELMELDEFGPNVYKIYKEHNTEYEEYKARLKEAYDEEVQDERTAYRSKQDAMRFVKGNSYKAEPFTPRRDYKTFCKEIESERPELRRPDNAVFLDKEGNPLCYISPEESSRLALAASEEEPLTPFDSYILMQQDIELSNRSYNNLMLICSGIQMLEGTIAEHERNRVLCIKVLGKYADKYEKLYQAELQTQNRLKKDGIAYDIPEHIEYPLGFQPPGHHQKPARTLIPKASTAASNKRQLVKKSNQTKEGEHHEY